MADLNEEKDMLNELFLRTDPVEMDSDAELLAPTIIIDLDEIDKEAKDMAEYITTKLSNFYFSEEWVRNHPYIEPKICAEMDNIRRLKKMLKVNEIAQDSLIQNISCNAGKGALYSALTSLQTATLNIQRQLDDLVNELEDIFRKMQSECAESFKDKDKETDNDGTITVRGSKDFIKQLTQKMYGEKKTLIDASTGEIISSTTNYTITEEHAE